MNKTTITGVILFAIIFAIIGPFIWIWALNVLFPSLAIPYTYSTWLAAAVVIGPLVNRSTSKN